jgi:hypothetical protein
MKMLALMLALLSANTFANCENLKPTDGFFTEEEVSRINDAQNWNDVCFDISGDPVDLGYCFRETFAWDKYFSCKYPMSTTEDELTPFLESRLPTRFGAAENI